MTTTASAPAPVKVPASLLPPLRRFSVDEYHRLLEAGILQSGERVELLDGFLVQKMTINPPHIFSVQATWQSILPLLVAGWELRLQSPITLATSEPEPDVAVARGTRTSFAHRHPGAADLGLVVEIADTSLAIDQTVKAPLYGGAGIPVYWIVDVIHRQVEVYTLVAGGGYGPPQILTPGMLLPLVLGGHHLGDIPVADLFV